MNKINTKKEIYFYYKHRIIFIILLFSNTFSKLIDNPKYLKNNPNIKNKTFNNFILKSNYINLFLFNLRYLQSNEEIDNSITVIANDPGLIYILSEEFRPQPNFVYVNDIITEINDKNQVNLIKEGENIIKMVWDNKLQTLQYMFNTCNQLISIDLSSFDTTSVYNIETMFEDCSLLKTITSPKVTTKPIDTI